mmetsp:Transcript_31225/g.65307  ORF Transcript_31225/g.65307 Transcript_31225/m.65307 type:complete len:246 (+) Transcript_31225:284-1021(+)
MLCEIVNSLFLTFLASEYLLASENITAHTIHNFGDDGNDPDYINKKSGTCGKLVKITRQLARAFFSSHSRTIQYSFIAVSFINLVAHFHDTGVAISQWIHIKLEGGFHIPRICVAIISFLVALYYDCRRVVPTLSRGNQRKRDGMSSREWSNGFFFRLLFHCFCRLLPIYPFLAVVISFGFLFVASLFEKMNIPTRLLNMPIYYGTLYGPLSFMYWDVKKGIVDFLKEDGRRLLGDESNTSYLPK